MCVLKRGVLMKNLLEKLNILKKETNILFIHTDILTLIANIKEQKGKETNIT